MTSDERAAVVQQQQKTARMQTRSVRFVIRFEGIEYLVRFDLSRNQVRVSEHGSPDIFRVFDLLNRSAIDENARLFLAMADV